MKQPLILLRHLVSDESGATLVEYSLVIGLIALACVVAITFLGGRIATFFSTVGNSISGAA
jgi:pilus assembly protein Flp/PilA